MPERQRRLRIVTPRFIDYAHAAGVEVHVWTVNEAADMRRLVALGVDGIVTDRADLALADAALARASSLTPSETGSHLCIGRE